MKKLILLAFVSVLFISCQQEKTAFVNQEKLVEDYQERKDIEAKYKTIMENYSKKRDSIRNAFKAEVAVFQAQEKSMSKEEAQKMYSLLGQKQQNLQQGEQIQEQTLAKESQEEIDVLLKKIDDAILEYGEANGYTYIFGKNKAGSVLYGADKNDITQTILDNLNLKYSE